jgi:hypothetical protein
MSGKPEFDKFRLHAFIVLPELALAEATNSKTVLAGTVARIGCPFKARDDARDDAGTKSGPSDCRTKDRGACDSIAANLSPHSEEKASAVQERPMKRRRAAATGGCGEK